MQGFWRLLVPNRLASRRTILPNSQGVVVINLAAGVFVICGLAAVLYAISRKEPPPKPRPGKPVPSWLIIFDLLELLGGFGGLIRALLYIVLAGGLVFGLVFFIVWAVKVSLRLLN
jgi:hypothetical protein